MFRKLLYITLGYFISFSALGSEVVLTKRSFNANRIQIQAPQIDGKISDEAWLGAEVLTNFVQNTPIPKVRGTQKTEVRMIYDDEAIYIAARMYERNTDSIYNFLTERDDFGNADFFIAVFNPYKDGINGDGFAVTPANVQIDIKYSLNDESNTWDAVWESATNIDELGWTVEMKIPYSALRFPETAVQEWGINFGREIRRNRERDWWNSIDPAVDGFFTQAGTVKGIKDIKPPTRLFFFPYASAYYEMNSTDGAPDNSSINGGMDVKYGINDAFTLDMTLIPDFGQVRFDDQVLNLTPFEVQFDENRQFFTEGVELFNKAGLFYSRRIGGRPYDATSASASLEDGERILENPVQSKLLNATKISGRTEKGLGVGFFNAFDDESYAVIENEELDTKRRVKTNPYTNYNVLVLDQVLRNNSFVTFTNTNTLRDGKARDANVSRLDLQLADKQNQYAISGFASMSHLWQEDGSLQSGESWRAAIGKISGNFTFELSQEVIGRDYDPNDLGFQTIRNVENSTLFAQLVKYEKFSVFNFYRHEFELIYQRLQQPNDFLNLGFSWFTVYRLQSFHALSLNAGFEPINTNDYFETRNFDLYYDYPRNFWFGGFFSSDYSRVFALDVRFNNRYFDEPGRRFHSYEIAPRFRPNDKLFFVISYQNRQSINDVGFVNNVSDSVIFGRRDVIENETSIEGNYIFNNTMALNLIFRHYWSEAIYNRFNRVDPENGKLLETDYPGFQDDGSSIHDISFNAFNIDLAFNWRFAPGSEISVVWKNIILQSGDPLDLTYYQNLEETLRAPQLNNFSIRILYFIDYLSLKGRG
jgi:hypothetical protein